MGIPVDYQDQDYEREYRNAVSTLSTAVHPPQECVGVQQRNEDQGQTCDVAGRGPLTVMVQGRNWSPGIYKALRRSGRTV